MVDVGVLVSNLEGLVAFVVEEEVVYGEADFTRDEHEGRLFVCHC